MKKRKGGSHKDKAWGIAKKRHRLAVRHVKMAREIGLNPKKLGKIDNHDQEPWKMPLRQYIEHLYGKRFGEEKLREMTGTRPSELKRGRSNVRKREPTVPAFEKWDEDHLPF